MPVATVTMLSQLLPGRDGALHSVTVIPVIAFGSYDNPEINRILGTEGELGSYIGLDAEWAMRALMVGGNYGEIFEANIGEATPIGFLQHTLLFLLLRIVF